MDDHEVETSSSHDEGQDHDDLHSRGQDVFALNHDGLHFAKSLGS